MTLFHRTLATDKGFQERVREDMLIRLLDAYVWRNSGKSSVIQVIGSFWTHGHAQKTKT